MRELRIAAFQGDCKAERRALPKAVSLALRAGGAAVMLSMSPMVLSQNNFSEPVELSSLDGSDGFVINGIDAQDRQGMSVSAAGDINGDGIDDVIIGAYGADPNGNSAAGESYVVFGGVITGSGGAVDLTSLDGSDGFVINGIDADDHSGFSVSTAGDFNGDGVDDVIIGALHADHNGVSSVGESYVVFGGETTGSSGELSLSLLDGSDGFVITGIDAGGSYGGDRAGQSVSAAGDINGDGVDDVIIGADRADPHGNDSAGESYVVFGGEIIGSSGEVPLSALDGSDGFVINGIDTYDLSGFSVSVAGDINGDGIDDVIIGAKGAGPDGSSTAGESYVFFGGESIGSAGTESLSSLDGSDGFIISGVDENDKSGVSVSAAGDVNGDGVDDVIIGAHRADPNGIGSTGASYVIFGGETTGVGGAVSLSALDGSDGYMITGVYNLDYSGISVSAAGDVNGDGVDDVIIGAERASPDGRWAAGVSYVLFGGATSGSGGEIALSSINGSNGFVINGSARLHRSGRSVSAAGDINGDGVDDVIIGAWAHRGGNGETGASYVVFGKNVPECNELSVTVDLNFGQTPGPGLDVVLGTPGDDDIRGRGGDDTICGMGGNDFIHGNSGNDWIDGGDGVDDLRGGQGDDVIHTGSGTTVGTLSLAFGGTGDDEIHGGADADDLRGGSGVDIINGNAGDDSIRGNADGDIIDGGAGEDLLRGGQGDDTMNGGSGDDVLSGGGGTLDGCNGGSGVDMATVSCETVSNVP